MYPSAIVFNVSQLIQKDDQAWVPKRLDTIFDVLYRPVVVDVSRIRDLRFIWKNSILIFDRAKYSAWHMALRIASLKLAPG